MEFIKCQPPFASQNDSFALINVVVFISERGVIEILLRGSGGVVNSLDFCPASLKSLGCFYFRCALSSQ